MIGKFFRFLFKLFFVLTLLGIAGGLGAGVYFYFYLTKDLPQIKRISDYQPQAVTSVYAEDGSLIAELYEQKRYIVSFDEIPLVVRNAFLAAEDANFYSHPGIDIISILRALYVNFRHKTRVQGASTITQQIVKSLLLSREKTYTRKAKEAILSYRLERALTKDEIFSIYLNEIYLGSRSYGIKAAAQVHFRKKLSALTLGEAAYLAGLPQKPSYLANPRHRDEAIRRQRYVLKQMFQNQMIGQAEWDAAQKEELTIFPPEGQQVQEIPYFTSHVIKQLAVELKTIDPALTATSPGGFEVFTTGDRRAHRVAERSVQKGLRVVDKRRGWRGPIKRLKKGEIRPFLEKTNGALSQFESGKIYQALVRSVGSRGGLRVELGGRSGIVNLKEAKWAWRLLGKNDEITAVNPQAHLRPGDIIEVSLVPGQEQDLGEEKPLKLQLNQTPLLQAAFVLLNALTGEVKVIVGGYDYEQSQFNRATQGLLQPGSSFKPIIYTAAIDTLGYTPATIVPDAPISMIAGDGNFWSPKNYDESFLGPITLRTALQRSRNVVSVFLLQELGVEKAIESARKFGITTPIPPAMAISLGAAEVHPLELARAYGVFATGGWLSDTIVIKKIQNRNKEVLFQNRPRQRRVIGEDTAFLMANMMKGVVERGTAQVVKKLGRPVAGKTGTTNEQMDAWFIGYTPEWVAGVWVGFDVKRTIGEKETGGRVAAPIFLSFMQQFLKDSPELDFEIPDNVIPVRINLETGTLANPESSRGFVEYFKSGTEPTEYRLPVEVGDIHESDEF